jgi:integrase
MRAFLNWMKRRSLIVANPLEHVQKVSNDSPGGFRRALSVDEIKCLLRVAPAHRATVYQTILYTGLRRQEINGLRWGDFEFEAVPPRLHVPSSISKNRKASTHFLRPELTETLTRFRPADAKPGDWAFRGNVPRVPTFKRDLAAAGIPFEDERGRRVDLHALRTTYGTLLSASGVSPRVAMELMRHSDLKLTMKVYTDASQLPLVQEAARLPSFPLLSNDSKQRTQIRTHEAVVLGSDGSRCVATGRTGAVSQAPASVTVGHEKAAGDATSRFLEMERANRLELSIRVLPSVDL